MTVQPNLFFISSRSYGDAHSIDEVIDQLEDIITSARQKKSRLGYFASLYRKVTLRVREYIQAGKFDDGERMERFDVIFANKYLSALDDYYHQRPIRHCWKVAFEYTNQSHSLILQHLLLGMNAHINYDLGISVVETSPGIEVYSLHGDFLIINEILASLVDEERMVMDRLSPWIGMVDHFSPPASRAIINFSMERARDFAWQFAMELAASSEQDKGNMMLRKDVEITSLGRFVAKPSGWLLQFALYLIRIRESKNIVKNIDVLNERYIVHHAAESFSI